MNPNLLVEAIQKLKLAHEDAKDYGYLDCRWPPEGSDGVQDFHLFEAIEAVLAAAELR